MNGQLINAPNQQSTSIPAQLRILVVVGKLWGCNGVTSHLHTLIKGLIQQDVTVALVYDIDAENQASLKALDRFQALGVECFEVPFALARSPFQKLTGAIAILRKFDMAIRKFQPDAIHLHSLSLCPYLQILRLLHSIPFVSTCHLEPAKTSSLKVKFASLFTRYTQTFFGDRIIAISSELKQTFQQEMGLAQERVRLVFHGKEEDFFYPPSNAERARARAELNVSTDAKVICLVGRLNPAKGHRVLFQAMSILRSQGIDAVALCAGMAYGDEEAVIRSQAIKAGVLDQVRLLGFVDTRQVLWASDVITLPSLQEGLPLVIIEAMLCGVVPIRTPGAGAFDQIEEGVNGFIVPFNDPQTLATRLKQLLVDEQLRAQLSEAALKSARQKFTVDRMIADTIALYQEVIAHLHSA